MDYVNLILSAAKTAKVSGPLLLAICTHESGLKNVFVPHDVTGPTYGICQVKQATAEMLGYKGPVGGLMIPSVNAEYAAKYLKYQKDRYNKDWCKATAAYNAGSYKESEIFPGLPKNLKYVRKVQSKLDESLQSKLSCE